MVSSTKRWFLKLYKKILCQRPKVNVVFGTLTCVVLKEKIVKNINIRFF